jgi:hypothetical protein
MNLGMTIAKATLDPFPGKGGLRVRRVFGDALLSGAALSLLLLVLIAVDGQVRDELSRRARNPRPAAALLEGAGERGGDLVRVIGDAARQQAVDHAPLLLFAFAGTVLLLFMMRT